MGWVVSSWRTERLAALLDDQAHAAARDIVLAAERDARRMERASARETADAIAYLEVLERVGEEVRAAVRDQRRAVRGGEGQARAPAPRREIVESPLAGEIRVERAPRQRRASMRESPLGELFRATVAR